MKKTIVLSAILLGTTTLFGQGSYFDTSFYSQALDREKTVRVYLPPGYDDHLDLHYPVIYFLHGLGGNHRSATALIKVADSLLTNGVIGPFILIGADNSCTTFIGSQYMNSIILGNYEDFMTTDLIAWVDSSFRTIAEKGGRTLMGTSMGANGSFRYGILHKDKYRALAAHAGCLDMLDSLFIRSISTRVLSENQPGPPYFFDYENSGGATRTTFSVSAAWSPNINSPQKHINPRVVEFPVDENGLLIDSVLTKWNNSNISEMIGLLTPADSVGIFFGCGSIDQWLYYPMNIRFKSILESKNLPYVFYDYDGDHRMPLGFMEQALLFLDSLMEYPGKHDRPARRLH
jgi:S-formylglutathione hydrolase